MAAGRNAAAGTGRRIDEIGKRGKRPQQLRAHEFFRSFQFDRPHAAETSASAAKGNRLAAQTAGE